MEKNRKETLSRINRTLRNFDTKRLNSVQNMLEGMSTADAQKVTDIQIFAEIYLQVENAK